MNREQMIANLRKVCNVSLKQVCKDLNVNYFNLLNCRASVETTKKVYDEYFKRINKALKEVR